ncbi:MAG: hypothetical protein ACO3RB_10015, partial [Ilumatobacteraceae bacterium]
MAEGVEMSVSTTRVYGARSGSFPGWWVVAGCFIVLFVSSALGFYGMSVYLNAFSKQFGWEISGLSVATTVFFLIGGLWNVVVARMIARYDVRWLMYPGAVLGAAALWALGLGTERIEGADLASVVTWPDAPGPRALLQAIGPVASALAAAGEMRD